MNKKLDETLGRVAEEVFESLAFVLPAFEEEGDPAERYGGGYSEESAPPEAADRTAASISFAGPFEGTLALSASNELLPAIAANMLGLDFGQVPSQEIQRDALKELLNVTCGNLLPPAETCCPRSPARRRSSTWAPRNCSPTAPSRQGSQAARRSPSPGCTWKAVGSSWRCSPRSASLPVPKRSFKCHHGAKGARLT